MELYKPWNSSTEHNKNHIDILPELTVLNGKYHIIDSLDSNEICNTYKCENPVEHASFIIRELDIQYSENIINFLRYFSKKPNVSRIVDYFETDKKFYYVRKYQEVTLLSNYVKNYGHISVNEALSILKPVMFSIREIHKFGIIHGNINPNEIIIKNGYASLINLGFSEINFNECKIDQKGHIFNMDGYSSPETYTINFTYKTSIDIYAVSAVLYMCITGVCPSNSIVGICDTELRNLSDIGINIDSGLETVIMKGLSISSKLRYKNMDALINALY